jgi:hypothetical protein
MGPDGVLGGDANTPLVMGTGSATTVYFTTELGGSKDDGAVVEYSAATNSYQSLGTFNGSNGQQPMSNLFMDRGNLYGTAFLGPPTGDGSNGVVFEVPSSGSGSITDVADFGGVVGSSPEGSLVLTSQGELYGTFESGGSAGLPGAYGEGGAFETGLPSPVPEIGWIPLPFLMGLAAASAGWRRFRANRRLRIGLRWGPENMPDPRT